MTSKQIPNGFIYTECSKDTKYGYHNNQQATRAGTAYEQTAKKTYTSNCATVNEGTRLPCGHVVSGGDKYDRTHSHTQVSKIQDFSPAEQQRPVYAQTGAFPGGTGVKKTKCQCPLYTYKRYDKMDHVKAEPAHYPANLKTVYTKDYPPKEADQHKMNFAPARTAQKSYPTKDNYATIQRVDYTPKKARSTTPIKQPEHKYIADVPFKGKTEYFDMTKDAFDHTEYQPAKKPHEPYQVKHGFPEKTEYEKEYTPKRGPKPDPNLKLSEAIFRGSTPQKNAAPLEDRTIYRGDYTPKRVDGPRIQVMRAHDANPMPRAKLFDGLTIYKKDYLSPELYQCECPEYEAANFGEHTHNHLPGHVVPATNSHVNNHEGHHHIHEVPVHEHTKRTHTEHIHESGPAYRYEKLEKSPLKTSALSHREGPTGASGRYFEKTSVNDAYHEKRSGAARGTVERGHGDHLHYIETMCEDHGGNHKHYIETLCPDHHHIHTVDK